MEIYSVELQKLTAIHAAIDETFLTQVISSLPQIGKETERYYLINNKFTLQSPNNLDHITIYNNFVMNAQRKGEILQLVKQVKNQEVYVKEQD